MSAIVWTGDAIPFHVPGCYVFDRWGREYIGDTDLGLCCCAICHRLRYGEPIGGWEASGWDGDGLEPCECQLDDEYAIWLRTPVVPCEGEPIPAGQLPYWRRPQRLIDLNSCSPDERKFRMETDPWLAKRWHGE